ncbi:MAG: ABC transporter ATP-binding protein [Lentisphaerae bacterium]|nr:ABC transporter ATP-binding protein [Lentisphaerota bacterium]MCP4101770.1 ABC transporter ATP-binding protein [Lentisphaerota bacterium]
MNDNIIISIENLSFAYENGETVLEDVNLTFRELESACIVGPNGGGKSTLLYLLLGLLKPTNGKITVFGKSPIEARLKMGYMPQYIQLDQQFPITVNEVVLMGRLKRGFWGRYSREDKEIAAHSMDEMSVSHLKKRTFAELSGGQRQRVLIARALTCRPDLLLLDEPTANVDPGIQEQFYETLYKLNKRMSILTVSHDLGFVSEKIDSVVCVNRHVNVHPTNKLDGNMIRDIYGYDVNMICHDYRCSEGSHTHGHTMEGCVHG